MAARFCAEVGALIDLLRDQDTELVVVASATLFLTGGEYHSSGALWADSLLLYGLMPLMTIVIVLRRNPLEFGLAVGDHRRWRYDGLLTCVLALPALLVAARVPSVAAYYTVEHLDLGRYALEAVAYLAGWEFLFRGYLLFGLKERFGPGSILVQMIPFALLHLGKPEIEVLSTIPAGILFGYVAYRGRSFWPAYLIHLFVNIAFPIIVNWA